MSGSLSLLVNNYRVLDFGGGRNYFNQHLHRWPHGGEHHNALQLNFRRALAFEDSRAALRFFLDLGRIESDDRLRGLPRRGNRFLSVQLGESVHERVAIPLLDDRETRFNAGEDNILHCFRLQLPLIPGTTQAVLLHAPLLLDGCPVPFNSLLPLVDHLCERFSLLLSFSFLLGDAHRLNHLLFQPCAADRLMYQPNGLRCQPRAHFIFQVRREGYRGGYLQRTTVGRVPRLKYVSTAPWGTS